MSATKRTILKAACGIYRVKTAAESTEIPVVDEYETMGGFGKRMWDAQKNQINHFAENPINSCAYDGAMLGGFGRAFSGLQKLGPVIGKYNATAGKIYPYAVPYTALACPAYQMYKNQPEAYSYNNAGDLVLYKRKGFWNTLGNVGEFAVGAGNSVARGAAANTVYKALASRFSNSVLGPLGAFTFLAANPTEMGDAEIKRPDNPFVPYPGDPNAPKIPTYNPNASPEEQASYDKAWRDFAARQPLYAAHHVLANKDVPVPMSSPEEQAALDAYNNQLSDYWQAYNPEVMQENNVDPMQLSNLRKGYAKKYNVEDSDRSFPRMSDAARRAQHYSFISDMRNSYEQAYPKGQCPPQDYMKGMQQQFNKTPGLDNPYGEDYGNPFGYGWQ